MAQRNLSEADIWYVIQNGRKVYRAGVLVFFLGEKDIPMCDRAKQRPSQLVGTNVLIDVEQSIILTAYRNKEGYKDQRKKSKFRRHHRAA